MSSAVIDSSNNVRTLDGRAGPQEAVTEQDVQEPAKLAKLLCRLVSLASDTARVWSPKRLDFEDVATPSSGTVTLTHNFGGRVRWWVVDWQPGLAGKVPVLARNAATDTNTLVLTSAIGGTATIRIEEAG